MKILKKFAVALVALTLTLTSCHKNALEEIEQSVTLEEMATKINLETDLAVAQSRSSSGNLNSSKVDFKGDIKTDFAVIRRIVGDALQWIVDTDHDGVTDIRTNYGGGQDMPIVQ